MIANSSCSVVDFTAYKEKIKKNSLPTDTDLDTVDGIASQLLENMMLELLQLGISTIGDEFLRSNMLLFEAIKSVLFLEKGQPHILQEFADNVFDMTIIPIDTDGEDTKGD
jgi:hypothetical protein